MHTPSSDCYSVLAGWVCKGYRLCTHGWVATIIIFLQGYAGPPLDKVTIVGVTGTPTSAQINGQNIANFAFDAATKVITLDDLDASMGEPFTITWV